MQNVASTIWLQWKSSFSLKVKLDSHCQRKWEADCPTEALWGDIHHPCFLHGAREDHLTFMLRHILVMDKMFESHSCRGVITEDGSAFFFFFESCLYNIAEQVEMTLIFHNLCSWLAGSLKVSTQFWKNSAKLDVSPSLSPNRYVYDRNMILSISQGQNHIKQFMYKIGMPIY